MSKPDTGWQTWGFRVSISLSVTHTHTHTHSHTRMYTGMDTHAGQSGLVPGQQCAFSNNDEHEACELRLQEFPKDSSLNLGRQVIYDTEQRHQLPGTETFSQRLHGTRPAGVQHNPVSGQCAYMVPELLSGYTNGG